MISLIILSTQKNLQLQHYNGSRVFFFSFFFLFFSFYNKYTKGIKEKIDHYFGTVTGITKMIDIV